jgi:hypothetical protein
LGEQIDAFIELNPVPLHFYQRISFSDFKSNTYSKTTQKQTNKQKKKQAQNQTDNTEINDRIR